MSSTAIERTVAGFSQVMKLERALVEHYGNARNGSDDPTLSEMFGRFESEHQRTYNLIDVERDRLQDLAGEGMLGETLEAIGRAFSEALSVLPVEFIESETKTTLETFRRLESGLLEHYEKLNESAPADSREVISQAIAAGRAHIAALDAVDPHERPHG